MKEAARHVLSASLVQMRMEHPSLRRVIALASIVVFAGLIPGCGGDDAGDAGPPSGRTARPPRPQPVRIALGGSRPIELSAMETQVLRAVVAELEACRSLLSAAEGEPTQLRECAG